MEKPCPVTSSEFLEKWGCDLETLYKLGIKFLKDKEGKAFHLGYDQKCKLLAFTQQVSNGPFNPDLHGNVGVLDVIGKDRKIAWQKLGDIGRESAMLSFVEILNSACPLFHACVEAHKKEIEMKAEKEKEDLEFQLKEVERLKIEAEEDAKREIQMKEQEEKRKQIKEALNLQTYDQFKTYAEQQYPENPDQQAILIRQLQEQHYIQYMQQIYQQQILSQNITKAEDSEFSQELPLDVEAAALNALASIQKIPLEPDNFSEASGNDEEELAADIVAASMWTRKDIREFKDSVYKEGKDSIIKVGHGETVTVRVPTHEDGSCLFWEFATDNYDIGFGLFFEWTKSPTEQVSVHISDSEDEDDDDDENVIEDDVEQGGNNSSHSALIDSNRPPISIVIPVYRRDCQEEVYAGSHTYPGQGVYLLKFDNSYSLWRSKTLYYRVYYTR
ncbi:Golgi resident protein GCP60-like isoform X1 [Daphnia pulicaria]|uniref:Golgi resident protein GCP60-like isoform X1 n=1 Tax=Daphnia pulicaria TaxID=35523 RepID=UPI001EEBB417|nr:Golgi resident protein GCP60-like isoform X1 [Daphnia pulicaria]